MIQFEGNTTDRWKSHSGYVVFLPNKAPIYDAVHGGFQLRPAVVGKLCNVMHLSLFHSCDGEVTLVTLWSGQ